MLEELEQQYPTADSLQQHFEELYGARDRLYLDERHERIRLFETGVADLFDALRREPTADALNIPFARVVARIFSMANSIDGVKVSEGMMMKFPLGGCAYCHQSSCACTAFRSAPTLGTSFDTEQSKWPLRVWQQYLDSLYGTANAQKGIWFVTTRLAVETNELVAEEDKVRVSAPADIRRNYALEIADTMAWTMAAASLLGVDIQTAALRRFGLACPGCHSSPCSCSRHNFEPVKFE